MHEHQWSDEAIQLTKTFFNEGCLSWGPDGVAMKHRSHGFGVISVSDYLSGKVVIQVRDTDHVEIFENIDQAISRGWVLD